MGTRIICPDPLFEPGDDCPLCTPSLWLTGKTPKEVKCVFSGMVKCDPSYPNPPNNHVFTLEQAVGFPCKWDWQGFIGDTEWLCQWWPDNGLGEVKFQLVDLTDFRLYFYYLSGPPCRPELCGSFLNTATCSEPWNYWADGGEGTIWYQPDDIPRVLSCSYHLQPLTGTLFHRFPMGIDHQIIRLANPIDKTNILVLVDNEEFS